MGPGQVRAGSIYAGSAKRARENSSLLNLSATTLQLNPWNCSHYEPHIQVKLFLLNPHDILSLLNPRQTVHPLVISIQKTPTAQSPPHRAHNPPAGPHQQPQRSSETDPC